MLLESIGGASNIVASPKDQLSPSSATSTPRFQDVPNEQVLVQHQHQYATSSSHRGGGSTSLTQNRQMSLRYPYNAGSTTISSSAANNKRGSAIMSTNTNSSLDFPCIEASRCFLTEREIGKRLTLEDRRNKEHNTTILGFSNRRSKQEEWYVQLETATINHHTPSSQSGNSHHRGTTVSTVSRVVRILRLRHCVTGLYLSMDKHGHTSARTKPDESTSWIMEPQTSPISSSADVSNSGTSLKSNNNHNNHNHNNHHHDHLYYTLRNKLNPQRQLKYGVDNNNNNNNQTTNNNINNNNNTILQTTIHDAQAAIWELEFTSGELCFISNPVVHNQIRCNPLGHLSVSNKFEGWEVFRFIEVGHGHVAISSWTHSNKYLSSDPDGNVTTTENRLGHWEKWDLQKADHGVHIVSVAHPGRYLSIGNSLKEVPKWWGDRKGNIGDSDSVLLTTTKPGDFAKWHLEAAHSHVYHLKSAVQVNSQDAFLSSNKRGAFLSKHRRDWEEWSMERAHDGCISLFSVKHKTFLGSNAYGEIVTTASKGDWSIWELEESPYGGIFLISKKNDRILAIGDDNQLCTTMGQYLERETWKMEPRLPLSLNGGQMLALGAAGVVGVALTVAMPYAVLGAVEAAGMTATELTLLAGFSAEAVAGISGGALLGAGVVGTTAAAVVNEEQATKDGKPAHLENKDNCLLNSMRPISAWRHW